jgi:hypothetical protein
MKKASLFLVAVILLATVILPFPVYAKDYVVNRWAVIVAGDWIPFTFLQDAYYMYWALVYHLEMTPDQIIYLSYKEYEYEPDSIDDEPTKANVRSAVNGSMWEASGPDEDDIVIMYFATHGRGLQINCTYYGTVQASGNSTTASWVKENRIDDDGSGWMDFYIEFTSGEHAGTRRDILAFNGITGNITFGGTPTFAAAVGDTFIIRGNKLDKGRVEINGDEGYEHFNATSEEEFGVDEGLRLQRDNSTYWDDELAQDLENLKYGTLILLFQACKTENASCFSGGFIDDLSASNRMVITSSNETSSSYGDLDGDGFSEFSEGFIDAICGWNTTFVFPRILLENEVNADFYGNGNGHVSILEAFQYAYAYDDGRLAVRTQNGTRQDWLQSLDPTEPPPDESPWFDEERVNSTTST